MAVADLVISLRVEEVLEDSPVGVEVVLVVVEPEEVGRIIC